MCCCLYADTALRVLQDVFGLHLSSSSTAPKAGTLLVFRSADGSDRVTPSDHQLWYLRPVATAPIVSLPGGMDSQRHNANVTMW